MVRFVVCVVACSSMQFDDGLHHTSFSTLSFSALSTLQIELNLSMLIKQGHNQIAVDLHFALSIKTGTPELFCENQYIVTCSGIVCSLQGVPKK